MKSTVRYCWLPLLAMLVLAPRGALAEEQFDDLPSHLVASSTTESSYDRNGRIIFSETRRYDSAGEFLGTNNHRYDWTSEGKLSRSEFVQADADDLQLSRIETLWDYSGKRTLRVGERTFYDGYNAPLKFETVTLTKDRNLPIYTVETVVTDPDGHLLETRYLVTEYDVRGSVIGRDEARYDGAGEQTYRRFESWAYRDRQVEAVKRYTYDEDDELVAMDVEEWEYNVLGKVVAKDTTRHDGLRQVVGYLYRDLEYNREGKITLTTSITANDHGVPASRTVTSWTYDFYGRLADRRTSVEQFELLRDSGKCSY